MAYRWGTTSGWPETQLCLRPRDSGRALSIGLVSLFVALAFCASQANCRAPGFREVAASLPVEAGAVWKFPFWAERALDRGLLPCHVLWPRLLRHSAPRALGLSVAPSAPQWEWNDPGPKCPASTVTQGVLASFSSSSHDCYLSLGLGNRCSPSVFQKHWDVHTLPLVFCLASVHICHIVNPPNHSESLRFQPHFADKALQARTS